MPPSSEEEFETLLHKMSTWPDATVETMPRTIYVLVRASHTLREEHARPLMDAAKLIFCDLPASAMVRMVVWLIFESVDAAVKEHSAH